jgi:4-alpha-glucanotransferase
MDSTFAARRAGVLCPIFALRTEADLGIGDTEAVRGLIDWASDSGLRFLQFLPINATGGDNSPYNAISSVALEPLTLDLSPAAVPELPPAVFTDLCARHGLASWATDRVDYPAVRALKGELLRAGHAQLTSRPAGGGGNAGDPLEPRRAALAAFRVAEEAWLDDFCLFRLLMDRAGNEDWPNWPEEYNTGDKARVWLAAERAARPEETEAALSLHAYAQWLCAEQWGAVRDHACKRGVSLMGDVPFGVSWSSADVFFRPGEFDLTWCGGAPPETYFKDDLFVQKWGQNWGIPLYNWRQMEAGGFQWWSQRVRKLTEIFSVFRIDHVLGFYRIYSFPWRPQRNDEFLPLTTEEAAARCGGRTPRFLQHDDDTPGHKAANLAQGDAFLRMILEAAAGAEVVAEDLGTVPDYVRPHLLSLDIPGFKICQWEEDEQGHAVQGAAYDNCSFTTYGTHDHEPMRTLWERLRREVEDPAGASRTPAAQALKLLCQFAWLHPELGPYPPYDVGIRRALLAALLHSNARFAAFTLTDLFGLEVRFNVPGVACDQNWSARLPMTLAEMQGDAPWREDCAWLAEGVKAAGRA